MDITNYVKPTTEEIGAVLAHWAAVRRTVDSQGAIPLPEGTAPSMELLQRVAAHQRWEEAMLCTHAYGITLSYGQPPLCSECDRPVSFLSDIQIADLKG